MLHFFVKKLQAYKIYCFADDCVLFQLFNTDWHKLLFSVKNEYVDMYVDCQLAATARLLQRGRVNTNGNIILGRQVPTGAPARVSTSLLMYCHSNTSGKIGFVIICMASSQPVD